MVLVLGDVVMYGRFSPWSGIVAGCMGSALLCGVLSVSNASPIRGLFGWCIFN